MCIEGEGHPPHRNCYGGSGSCRFLVREPWNGLHGESAESFCLEIGVTSGGSCCGNAGKHGGGWRYFDVDVLP